MPLVFFFVVEGRRRIVLVDQLIRLGIPFIVPDAVKNADHGRPTGAQEGGEGSAFGIRLNLPGVGRTHSCHRRRIEDSGEHVVDDALVELVLME